MAMRGSGSGGALLRALGYATYPLSRMGAGRSGLVRAGWRLFAPRLVGDVATARLNGLSLQMFSRDLFAMNVLLRGNWETYELELFRSSIRPGMTVADVGAHVGLYSLVAADALGGAGKVIAFEPEPANFRLLLRNIEANGFANVTAVQKAVAGKCGALDFYVDPAQSTLHSLRPLREGQAPSFSVEVTTLDEFFANERADVVKMDIEGSEGSVLKGMRGLIRRSPAMKLFCEFNPTFLRAAGTDPAAFVSELAAHGFTVWEISQSGHELIPFDESGIGALPEGEGVELLCTR